MCVLDADNNSFSLRLPVGVEELLDWLPAPEVLVVHHVTRLLPPRGRRQAQRRLEHESLEGEHNSFK